ncbi:MAG: hypothetical protein ACM3OC_09815 [Deltaproteobacteria bacterium]
MEDHRRRKGQSVTELATFGSILLLVTMYLLRYGLQYNYQQDVQMEAFRRALAKEFSRTDEIDQNSGSVVHLVKDSKMIDPTNPFGTGSVSTLRGSADVVWSNTMMDPMNTKDPFPYPTDQDAIDESKLRVDEFNQDQKNLPVSTYVFNPQTNTGITKNYTTAGYGYKDGIQSVSVDMDQKASNEIPPQTYTVYRNQMKQIDNNDMYSSRSIRSFLTQPEAGQQTDYGKWCMEHYCPPLTIAQADVDADKRQEMILVPFNDNAGSVLGPTDSHVTSVVYFDRQQGQIDEERTQVDRLAEVPVTPQNVQGLLSTTDTYEDNTNSLHINDNSGSTTATAKINEMERLTHVVRKNGSTGSPSTAEDKFTFWVKTEGSQTWSAPK